MGWELLHVTNVHRRSEGHHHPTLQGRLAPVKDKPILLQDRPEVSIDVAQGRAPFGKAHDGHHQFVGQTKKEGGHVMSAEQKPRKSHAYFFCAVGSTLHVREPHAQKKFISSSLVDQQETLYSAMMGGYGGGGMRGSRVQTPTSGWCLCRSTVRLCRSVALGSGGQNRGSRSSSSSEQQGLQDRSRVTERT